jgi:hypothetical protein
MTRAAHTLKLTGIPRRQEDDSSGLGKFFFLTSGSKGPLQHDKERKNPSVSPLGQEKVRGQALYEREKEKKG